MFDKQRFGNDGTEPSWPCKPHNGDNQMKEKDEDIAHPGMVSNPEKTPKFWTNSVIRHGHGHKAFQRLGNAPADPNLLRAAKSP